MKTAVADNKARGRLAARLRAALSKLVLWLRTALSKLPPRLRAALAALALWLAVQHFRIMPRSIDIGAKLRNPPPAEVRQLDGLVHEFQPQLFVTGEGDPIRVRLIFVSSDRAWRLRAPESLTPATRLPLATTDDPEPATAVSSHERNQLEEQQGPALPLGADEPRRTTQRTPAHRSRRRPRPAARPTAPQGRATPPQNRHRERRPRDGHRPLDGLLTVLTLVQIIPLGTLRLFGRLRLSNPIRLRRKSRSRGQK
jgi:hypothetical protein